MGDNGMESQPEEGAMNELVDGSCRRAAAGPVFVGEVRYFARIIFLIATCDPDSIR